jgi:adenylate cyclase
VQTLAKALPATGRWLRLRRNAFYRGAHILLPAALLFSAVWMRARGWEWTEAAQHRAFDLLLKIQPRTYEPTPVKIVDIDDETLSKMGQWPWPRTLIGRLVRKLSESGAAVVAFDAVFPEPDRTSPTRVVRSWPDTPELASVREKAKTLPDHDALFARDIAAAGNVTLGFVLIGDDNDTMPLAKARFAYAGDGPLTYLPRYPGAVKNLDVLEKAAAGNGNFGFAPEHDGIIRRVPIIFRRADSLIPSLSAEALRVAQGATNFAVKSSGASGEQSFGAHTGISKIKIGSYVVPTDEKGRVWVYYTPSTPERVLPAWKILEKGFDPELVRGCILFVGTSAAGLKDLRATPLDPAAAGVDVHANVAEQILLQKFLQRPDWATGAEILYMVALGAILLILLPRLGAAWCAPVGFGGIGLAIWVSWHSFTKLHYLIDPVFPSLTMLGIYMSSTIISYLKSEAERRQLRGTLSRYMSPKLAEEIAKHPEKLRLGGETRTMTFHFCDIRGFTTISEQFDPHGLTQFINRFLTPMTEIIFANSGIIDKYMGDCIMAFWNAPLDDPKHAVHACKSALEMHKRLNELNDSWRAEAEKAGKKFIPIHIGTGLNTGPCVVGNLGSDQRFDYSVLGDDVNLASRLEGQSKTYGVDIVVGNATKDNAPDFAFLELDLIKVKGKTVPVRIFALLGDKAVKDGAPFKDLEGEHQKMLSAYRHQNWDHALELIETCKTFPFKLEKLYHLYEDRIALYREQAPGEGWDGTFTATSK